MAAVDRILSRDGVTEIRISSGQPAEVRILVHGVPRHWFAATAETALLLADGALAPRVQVQEVAPGKLGTEEEL